MKLPQYFPNTVSTLFPASSLLMATRESLIFTMTFPFSDEITDTVSPTTKPMSSRCFLVSGPPPTFRITDSSPGLEKHSGIKQIHPLYLLNCTNSVAK